jgi:hypothetical protein
MTLSLYEFMEDFDNSELSDYERDEQLMEAVKEYNEKNNTSYNPEKSLIAYKIAYKAWVYRKYNDQ